MLIGGGEQQLTGTQWSDIKCDIACQCLVGSDTDGESGDDVKFHLGLRGTSTMGVERCDRKQKSLGIVTILTSELVPF